MDEDRFVHQPVLLGAVLDLLNPPADGIVIDATIGQAGHAAALAERLGPEGVLIGLDVDPESLGAARERLAGARCRVELVRENFGRLGEVLDQLQIPKIHAILADLGLSSAQLADPARGISFQSEGPLDMRLDSRLKKTAADLVNSLPQVELANLIFRYGEERASRRIARFIFDARRQGRIGTTGQLVEIINRALGITGKGHKSKINPATRTFQALRIAVNDELGQLENLLVAAPARLAAGGRIAVISFHSLEDRIIKLDFREKQAAGVYQILTKKPITADEAEKSVNPRSRSAKLRGAGRI